MIKKWEERQAESTEEWNDMPLGPRVFMQREIDDLRARVAELEAQLMKSLEQEQLASNQIASHLDNEHEESVMMAATLSREITEEEKELYKTFLKGIK